MLYWTKLGVWGGGRYRTTKPAVATPPSFGRSVMEPILCPGMGWSVQYLGVRTDEIGPIQLLLLNSSLSWPGCCVSYTSRLGDRRRRVSFQVGWPRHWSNLIAGLPHCRILALAGTQGQRDHLARSSATSRKMLLGSKPSMSVCPTVNTFWGLLGEGFLAGSSSE
ncbi:hypothetical protein VTI74DRAFT_352 [Chaetomium olivicolor]